MSRWYSSFRSDVASHYVGGLCLAPSPPDGDGRLLLTCGRCGQTWDRDVSLRCTLCSSEDVEGVPTSTLQEKGRGDQWAPSGIRLVYYCWACGGDDVTSSKPRPGPNPPPGGSQDLRAFRGRGG